MKSVIYIRTSTKEQNPENQLEDCRTLSGEVSEVVRDEQSAWKDKDRRGFSEVLEGIRRHSINHLYVWDLDRIYRNRIRLIEFFRFCKSNGCQIHSFRQTWLSDIEKMPSPWNEMVFDMMLQVMGWLVEEESNKKSARVKASIRNEGGVTRSYRGNKWGRRSISNKNMLIIADMTLRGCKVRDISMETGLAVGTVHKYMKQVDISDLPRNILVQQRVNK